jgi:poly(3-hydroxybutyrate) depolymerase
VPSSRRLTPSQQRILECTHRLAEANADIPYTLFVPSTYDPQKPAPLVVDLHGLNITPLQPILWIRRGATQMEKVFLVFSLVSKRTTVLLPR